MPKFKKKWWPGTKKKILIPRRRTSKPRGKNSHRNSTSHNNPAKMREDTKPRSPKLSPSHEPRSPQSDKPVHQKKSEIKNGGKNGEKSQKIQEKISGTKIEEEEVKS